jgi:hypothetical protein
MALFFLEIGYGIGCLTGKARWLESDRCKFVSQSVPIFFQNKFPVCSESLSVPIYAYTCSLQFIHCSICNRNHIPIIPFTVVWVMSINIISRRQCSTHTTYCEFFIWICLTFIINHHKRRAFIELHNILKKFYNLIFNDTDWYHSNFYESFLNGQKSLKMSTEIHEGRLWNLSIFLFIIYLYFSRLLNFNNVIIFNEEHN